VPLLGVGLIGRHRPEDILISTITFFTFFAWQHGSMAAWQHGSMAAWQRWRP